VIEIHGNNQSANVTVDFDTLRTHLQGRDVWGADVLRLAGEHGWRVATAGMHSKGPLGAYVIDEGPDSIVAWGVRGKKSFLAYRIERVSVGQVNVTPLSYLESKHKAALAISLALLFILPVLLSPLVWWTYQVQTVRASRVYLPTFGRYLELLETGQDE